MSKTGQAYEDSLLTDWSKPPPSFVLKSIMSVVKTLQGLLAKLNPPSATVLSQFSSFIPATWLMMTAKLGIADLLKDGPLTAAELAAKAGVREDDLYRALRMLAVHGFYEALPGANGQPARFRNNAASATLRSDHPNSVKHLAIHFHDNAYTCYAPEPMEWHLRQTAASNDELPCLFEHAHDGKDFWEWVRERPEIEINFSKAMSEVDSLGLEATLQDFNWSRFGRIIDIGGANGSVLFGVLKRNPKMRGVLFDQPQVVERAEKIWAERSDWKKVGDRVSLVGGDFFKAETLPQLQDGDLLYMRNILHDWTDEASGRILKALRQAVGSAKVSLVICEMVLNPEFSSSPLHVARTEIDLQMLALTRGRERTPAQWEALFSASGFKVVGVRDMRCPQAIVEAVPV